MAKLSTEDRDDLSKGSFAFPKQRKEPLENASHVRNAIARFNQVKDVSDDERIALEGLRYVFGVGSAPRRAALEARWGMLVPVLLADGQEVCHYRLDTGALDAIVAPSARANSR